VAERLTLGRPRLGGGPAPESPRPRRRATDTATWLALGLLVAVVLVFATRGVDRPPRSAAHLPAATVTPLTTASTVPATAPSTATTPVTPVTTTAHAHVGGIAPAHGAAVPPTTAASRPAPADAAVAAPRRRPSVAISRTELASLAMPGSLRYPNDVATRYPFRTSGGRVSATLTATGGDARVTLGLDCSGARAHRVGGRTVSVAVEAPLGSCVLVVSEPAKPGAASLRYHLFVRFPTLVTGSP